MRQLLWVLRERQLRPDYADKIGRKAGFPTATAFVQHEFRIHVSGQTTPDLYFNATGRGSARLVAHYALPAFYGLLWAGQLVQHPVTVCARPGCGEVFQVGPHDTQRYHSEACQKADKTRRARERSKV
jgi:hypothetical protein